MYWRTWAELRMRRSPSWIGLQVERVKHPPKMFDVMGALMWQASQDSWALTGTTLSFRFAFSPWKLAAAWIHFAGGVFLCPAFCISLSQGSPDLQSAVCRNFDPRKVQSTGHFSEQMWSPPPPHSQTGCLRCQEIFGDTSVWWGMITLF